ncbi:Vacuolar protein sorting-associated protein Ist1 [Dillenia turbinata]|uniref:Vacuolar protein sorting-associated protein Ist1 n=1 Tax=Dillenia turbinata TaxID=194707 RepID=A0AAN8Z5W5_9MAGN
MSLLNQLFNRGGIGAKCKTGLTLAISRIKLIQNKRDVQLKHMRKEIAQFLQTGQEPIARIRVEHVIREQNMWAAYEIMELFCELILARVPIIESQRECPSELREAIASIIFAAPRCSDLPDLLQIKNLFGTKYGKEFVLAASELRPDTSVNRTIIEKLSVSAPSPEAKLKLLKEIALEYSLEWDSSNTEAELSKKHEDLLDGSRQMCISGPALLKAPTPQAPFKASSLDGEQSVMTADSKQAINSIESPGPTSRVSFSETDVIEPLEKNLDAGATSDTNRDTRSQSSEILERARAAITSAERASAAARAAAELANIKYGCLKLNDGKS